MLTHVEEKYIEIILEEGLLGIRTAGNRLLITDLFTNGDLETSGGTVTETQLIYFSRSADRGKYGGRFYVVKNEVSEPLCIRIQTRCSFVVNGKYAFLCIGILCVLITTWGNRHCSYNENFARKRPVLPLRFAIESLTSACSSTGSVYEQNFPALAEII